MMMANVRMTGVGVYGWMDEKRFVRVFEIEIDRGRVFDKDRVGKGTTYCV